jgi:drug/metabolite transporter (DMT)-like permease
VPALIAGILTSIAFASSTMTSARASRLAGPAPVLAGVMLTGAVLVLPVALVLAPLRVAPPVPALTYVTASLGGAANIVGLLLVYAALRIGTVGTVSTIASTEGAIAAIVSVIAGQALAPGAGIVLAAIAVGVALAASGGGHEIEEGRPVPRSQTIRAAGLAAIAACVFGFGLFLTGSISGQLPPAWVILPGRLIGVASLVVPLLVLGRLRLPRQALPFVIATGITEVVGFSTYAIGASSDTALTAVLASMFAPIAAVAAFVLFRERLARVQVVGIGLVVIGVALLGWLSA